MTWGAFHAKREDGVKGSPGSSQRSLEKGKNERKEDGRLNPKAEKQERDSELERCLLFK